MSLDQLVGRRKRLLFGGFAGYRRHDCLVAVVQENDSDNRDGPMVAAL
jgi:hypothetical protein